MMFADFAGNQRIVAVLRRMLASERMHHALLFQGPVGVGKFTLATLFARAANCLARPGEGCPECNSCRALACLADLEKLRREALAARGSASPEAVPLIVRPHPGVTVLVPDGAFIRVSQMRYLVREAYAMPAGARRSFFLIDQADRLRFDYADVLLKVLEEPPASTTLILVTHAPFSLRPTIRSRCLPFHFAPLAEADIAAYLRKHKPEWKKTERQLAAAYADGSLGTALRLDLETFLHLRREALQLLRAATGAAHQPSSLFAATATLAGKRGAEREGAGEGRERFEFALDILYSLLKDTLYTGVGASPGGLRHPDVRDEVKALSQGIGVCRLRQAVSELDRIHGWQRRNINRQLALDAWSLGQRS
ncbi:MAG: ATP-binding protein [Terriglobia bacterium]